MKGGWAQDFALATALALFLAVLGPYGSYLNGPLWQRVVFQAPCAWVACGVIGLGVRFAAARLGGGLAVWTATVLVAAVSMMPVTLLNIVLAARLWPFLSRRMTPAAWYFEGLIIAVPVSLGFLYLALRRSARSVQQAEAEADAKVRPAAGLLGVDPREVLCLQMEDHYVRVHTAARSRLVLATFGQALEGLAGAPGLRVHRSWWVAEGAVVRAELDGRNLKLILNDGLTAPVARTSVAEVRARGWLQSRAGRAEEASGRLV